MSEEKKNEIKQNLSSTCKFQLVRNCSTNIYERPWKLLIGYVFTIQPRLITTETVAKAVSETQVILVVL